MAFLEGRCMSLINLTNNRICMCTMQNHRSRIPFLSDKQQNLSNMIEYDARCPFLFLFEKASLLLHDYDVGKDMLWCTNKVHDLLYPCLQPLHFFNFNKTFFFEEETPVLRKEQFPFSKGKHWTSSHLIIKSKLVL